MMLLFKTFVLLILARAFTWLHQMHDSSLDSSGVTHTILLKCIRTAAPLNRALV